MSLYVTVFLGFFKSLVNRVGWLSSILWQQLSMPKSFLWFGGGPRLARGRRGDSLNVHKIFLYRANDFFVFACMRTWMLDAGIPGLVGVFGKMEILFESRIWYLPTYLPYKVYGIHDESWFANKKEGV